VEQKVANTSEVFFDTAMKRQATNDVIKEILQQYDVPEMTVKGNLRFIDGKCVKPSDYFRMVKLWDDANDNEYSYFPPDRFDYLDSTASYYWTEDYDLKDKARRLLVRPRPTSDVTTGNIVLNFNFNEGSGTTATDSSINSLDGTITGATYVPSISGTGLEFDGDSGEVLISAASAMDDIFDSGGSLSIWFKPDSTGEANQSQLLGKDDPGTDGWFLSVQSQSNEAANIVFTYRFTGTDGIWAGAAQATIGEWNHLVLTYDSDAVGNDPIMYVNGSSVTVTEASTPVGTREPDASNDLRVGNNSAGNRTFDGIIDEVRLYSDTLTAAEVADLYEQLDVRYIKVPTEMTDDSTDSGLSAQWDEVIAYGVASRLFQIANRYDEAREMERLYRDRLADVYLVLKTPGGIKQGNRLKSKYERRSQLGVNSVSAINL